MNVTVNGETRALPDGATITDLLALLEIRVKHVAVERNLEVVPRGEHGSTRLEDGDALEVVTLVGGG